MKKTLKKISLLILVLVAALGMNLRVFAKDLEPDGIAGSSNDAAGNEVTLKKAIEVTNYSGYAYEPTITYTYTMTAWSGTGSETITTEGSTIFVKNGIIDAVKKPVQTAVFNSASEVTAADKKSVKDVTWEFDPTKFSSSGVYRYIITETSDKTPTSIGMEARENDYNTEKYLDVYVRDTTSGEEIYAYTLMNDYTNTTTKTQGWNVVDDLDKYNTYNLTINKIISGSMADKSAKFPFTLSLSGKMSSANIVYIDGTTSTAINVTEGSGTTADTSSVQKELSNGDSLVIKGLPKTVKFNITEKNPTTQKYVLDDVSVSGIVMTNVTTGKSNDLSVDSTVDNVVLTNGDVGTATNNEIAVSVKNKLDAPSPTGVILYFAPYLLIGACAILLIVVSVKRRRA